MLLLMELASPLGLPAQDWAALATWSGVTVAVGGGLVALQQLRHTWKLRDEQARPYVAVYLATTRNESVIYDLVIKNFGVTAASNVVVQIEPPPERAIDKDNPNSRGLALPDVIPTLVPGQEWRTIWDSGMERYDSELPRRYEATVSFADSGGKTHQYDYVIDWGTLFDTEYVVSYGMHHAAKSLREISKTMGKWTQGAAGGLSVVARNGDARDRRDRERRNARLAAQRPPDDPPEAGDPTA